MSAAIDHLERSQLGPADQLEAMGGDVDLADFNLQMRNKAGIKLVTAITSADIERTIQGASTLTVGVEDDLERTIQKSGRLGKKVDVNINGLWFTLVAVKKTGRQLKLVFEEREVNLLRYYNSWLKADRSKVNRAHFVLRMINEVREQKLRWVIPELNIDQPISDVAPGQVLVDLSGQSQVVPQIALDPGITRQPGIPSVVDLTVKGQAASTEQLGNASIILQTGTSMRVSYKVLVCSIMTAIDESSITNLTGGDRDSVGIFQQRKSQGWPATRNVATDAAAFFREAARIDAANPTVSYEMLCQGVQRSGTSDGSNYRPWRAEAEAFAREYGVVGIPAEANNQFSAPAASGVQYFMRGRIEQHGTSSILTKESSWDCMQRLAQEENWRCFVVSGVIYFVSEAWLFRSKAFMTISEDTPGIETIDYDYDEGKREAIIRVECHLSRWSAPPGCIVRVIDMGIPNGRYLVNDVQRSIYDSKATITLKKPLPKLPEPSSLGSIPSNAAQPGPASGGTTSGGKSSQTIQAQVVSYAKSQLGVPYQWGAESPGVAFDCSGLTQAAYSNAGVNIPRVAQAQYEGTTPKLSIVQDPQPGDLLFFGTSSNIHHVGICIGGGQMIDAAHSGTLVRIESFRSWHDYYGATRPWLVD